MNFLHRIVALVEKAERMLCILFGLAFTGLVVVNVVLRYAFSHPLYFAEEVSVILMIWMTLFAASLLLGRRELVAVTILIEPLPRWGNRVAAIAVDALTVAIVATFAWFSIAWMRTPASQRDLVLALDIPKWYPYLIVPIFFSLASLKALNNLASSIEGRE